MEEALRVVLVLRDGDPPGLELGQRLRSVGCRVVVVRSGSGEEIVRQSGPGIDLIILATPPEGPARETLVRRLKAEPGLSDVPVLRLHDGPGRDTSNALFDALGDGIALIDGSGTILRCNHAMARLLGLESETAVGRDLYAEAAGLTIRRGDLPGSSRREVVEWPRGDRLYRVTAAPFEEFPTGEAPGGGAILVVAADISERHTVSGRAAESHIGQLEHDERLLRRFSPLEAAPTLSADPLRTSHADTFRELVQEYEGLLERVLDRLTYRVSDPLSEPLRALAARLGRLGAGPRDVVELHGTALRHKSAGVPATQARALADEGRLLVLELMGHLVTYYRQNGGGRDATPSTANPPKVEGRNDGEMLDQVVRDGTDAPVPGRHRQPAPDLRGRP